MNADCSSLEERTFMCAAGNSNLKTSKFGRLRYPAARHTLSGLLAATHLLPYYYTGEKIYFFIDALSFSPRPNGIRVAVLI